MKIDAKLSGNSGCIGLHVVFLLPVRLDPFRVRLKLVPRVLHQECFAQAELLRSGDCAATSPGVFPTTCREERDRTAALACSLARFHSLRMCARQRR